MQDWFFIAIFIVIAWLLFGRFHYYIIPPLDKHNDTVRKIIFFIASLKNVEIDPKASLPIVNILPPQSPTPEITWNEWAYVADFIYVGYYDPDSGRIVLLEGCRQNILVHELVHYIQSEYKLGDIKSAGCDQEAWEITRLYLKFFHPYRYKFFMIMTFNGVFDWWTSMPY